MDCDAILNLQVDLIRMLLPKRVSIFLTEALPASRHSVLLLGGNTFGRWITMLESLPEDDQSIQTVNMKDKLNENWGCVQ
jgi:hypothetical protein